MKAVIPGFVRKLVEPGLPAEIEPVWIGSVAEAKAEIVDAEIAWVDLPPHGLTAEAVREARALRWLFTAVAGLDSLDLDALGEAGTLVTNGTGILAEAVADYAVLGVLAAAKRFDEVVRAADRHEWLRDAPGKLELSGSRALVVGYGAIGRLIGERLKAFGVEVTGVTRSAREGTIAAGAWRERLGEFDWVILAAPSTGETRAMIGADELAAMKPAAWLVNIARGDMIEDNALIAALKDGSIAGAFLDPTDPEPLPADHPLWDAPNCMITMHLSGRSQTSMFRRASELFLKNARAFLAGEPMENRVDLDAGY